MENLFIVRFETFVSVILAMLGFEGWEYEGFFDYFKEIRLNFKAKKYVEGLTFEKQSLLRNLGIDGYIDIKPDTLSGYFDVKFKTNFICLSEMAFEIPQKTMMDIIKILFMERFNINDEKFLKISTRSDNSIVIDVDMKNMNEVTVYGQDLRSIALIDCTLSIENIGRNILRFVMTF